MGVEKAERHVASSKQPLKAILNSDRNKMIVSQIAGHCKIGLTEANSESIQLTEVTV